MAIKQYLTELAIIVSLDKGDMFYLYLAVSEVSVSASLFKEDGNKDQYSS